MIDHVELQLQKYKRGHTSNSHKTRYILGVEMTNLEEINHVVMGRHYLCIAIDDTENLAVQNHKKLCLISLHFHQTTIQIDLPLANSQLLQCGRIDHRIYDN